jgi:hypothetical protein
MFRKCLLLGVVIGLLLGVSTSCKAKEKVEEKEKYRGKRLYVISVSKGKLAEEGYIHLYDTPTYPHEIVTSVRPGESGIILEKYEEWYKVKLDDGKKGWINRGPYVGTRFGIRKKDPRVFFTLTTVTGKEIVGYLLKEEKKEVL